MFNAPMRLDPELAAIAVLLPEFDFSDLDEARRFEALLLAQGRHQVPGVASADRSVPHAAVVRFPYASIVR